MRFPVQISAVALGLTALGTAALAQSNIAPKPSAALHTALAAHSTPSSAKELQGALNDLQNARSILNHASFFDSNGHRGRAIDKIDQAEIEIRANMRDDQTHK